MTATSTVEDRQGDAVGMLAELWPEARVDIADLRTAPRGGRCFLLIPSAARPRLLVPADAPQVAALAVDRVSAEDGYARATLRAALAAALRTGMAARAFSRGAVVSSTCGDSIEAHLATIAHADVRVAIAPGAPRANRKPVLNVCTHDGREIGFAKVGLTELAGRLVQDEESTLRTFSARPPATFDVPQVHDAQPWRNHPVLIMSSLRGRTRPRRPTSVLPIRAMREVAERSDVTRHEIQTSSWLSRLRARAAGLASQGDERLAGAVELFARRHGSASVAMGSWHGDWGPWNMAWSGHRPLVWDWERYAADVPAGLDAAHFIGHRYLRRVGDVAAADHALNDVAGHAVHSFLSGWSPSDHSHEVVAAVIDSYLLEITARFMTDAGGSARSPIRGIADWHVFLARRRWT